MATRKPAVVSAPQPAGSVPHRAASDVPFCRDPDPGAPEDALTLAQLEALTAAVFGGTGDDGAAIRGFKAKRRKRDVEGSEG